MGAASTLGALQALVLGGVVLYFAKPFLLPLVFAILISFILAPIANALQGWGLNRALAVMGTVTLAFAVTGLLGWATATEVQHLAVDLPKHKGEIRAKIDNLRTLHGGALGDLLQMVRELDESSGTGPPPDAPRVVLADSDDQSSLARIFGAVLPVLEPLATVGLVVVLVIFMLINREDLRDRVVALMSHRNLPTTTRMFGDTAQRLSQYLLAQLAVNCAFGLVFAAVAWLIGLPFALLWGLLTAILRFVPYVGTWLAAAFPVALAFALFPGWWQSVALIVCFVVIDAITANVIEPLVFGHNTGVAPVALLIAAAFWTWIWGPMGLVLSTPITVCLVVLGQHVPRFHFVSVLLGGQPPVPPQVGFYQRLLAGDVAEAKQRALEYAEKNSLEAAFEDVILPTLIVTRRDRKRDLISTQEEEQVYKATEEILAGLDAWHAQVRASVPAGDRTPEPELDKGLPPTASPTALLAEPATRALATASAKLILGYPAHHTSEELVLKMLHTMLEADGLDLRLASSKMLPSDIVAAMRANTPSAVLIAVLPPGGLPQAKYLCELIRDNFPDVRIVVAYFGAESSFDRVLGGLRRAGVSYVTTSLNQTKGQVQYLAQEAD
jgi:predicted PurR-regulated permease PerM